jgi:DNA-directed RNA polymerase subunit E'/Rpb7
MKSNKPSKSSKSYKSTNNTTNNNNNNNNNKTEIIKNKIFSPYTDTVLEVPIMLLPNQLDNKLDLHIKQNLIQKHVGKCLNNYGYICKIYKILEISTGYIEPEDFTCSSKQNIKFACRICRPIKNKDIILKITKTRSEINAGVNGPLLGLITPDNINRENFLIDGEKNIRSKKTSEILVPNAYVRCEILNFEYSDKENETPMLVLLKDMATKEEIDEYEKQIKYDIDDDKIDEQEINYLD